MRTNLSLALLTLVSLATGACGLDDPDSGTTGTPSLNEQLAALDRDLGPGSRGGVVRALHDHLTRIGYFPNEALATQYPRWRPFVAKGPSDPAVYDDQTRQAVAGLQALNGLEPSGVVDAPTRGVLGSRFCNVPDWIEPMDPSEKFAYVGTKWTRSVTWGLANSDGDLSSTELTNALTAAFATWSQITNISFSSTNPLLADIIIRFDASKFQDMQPCEGFAACVLVAPGAPCNFSFPPLPPDCPSSDIFVDPAVNWSVTLPTPAGRLDFVLVMTHEIGHSIGLGHSAWSGAMMWPNGNGTRQLDVDDKIGASSLYDRLVNRVGAARDIGINTGAAWVIGTTPASGGFTIHATSGSTWGTSNGAGVRISVGKDNIPWLVNSFGQIFRRNTFLSLTGDWVPVAGSATDISAGPEGHVWKIDTTPISGGFTISQFNGSGWTPDVANGGAVRIAVDSAGVPWVVNNVGQVFRRTSNTASSGGWSFLPLPSGSGPATDIGVNPTRTVRGDGGNSVGGNAWVIAGSRVFVRQEQPVIRNAAGEITVQGFSQWVPVFSISGGSNTAIAVNSSGTPWIVQNNGTISSPEK